MSRRLENFQALLYLYLMVFKAIVLAGLLATAPSVPEMKPRLAARGKLLFSDDFAGPEISKEWKVNKGRYQIADGALKGVELASDHHPANVVYGREFKDAIFQFSFRFEGARQVGLILVNSKGHVGRVTIRPNEFMILAEKANANAPGQSTTLSKVNMKFEQGKWYTMLFEVVGNKLMARVDDEHVAQGEDARIGAGKNHIGLPVNGESASFAHVRMWEAVPEGTR